MSKITKEQLQAFAAATNGDLYDPEYRSCEWLIDAVETQETIADFEASSKKYAECTKAQFGTAAGFSFVAFAKVQVKKGDTRRSLSVIDFGDARMAIDADLTDYT